LILCDAALLQSINFFAFLGFDELPHNNNNKSVDFFQRRREPRALDTLNAALSGQEQPSTSRAIAFVRSRVLLSSFTSRFLFSLSTGLKE